MPGELGTRASGFLRQKLIVVEQDVVPDQLARDLTGHPLEHVPLQVRHVDTGQHRIDQRKVAPVVLRRVGNHYQVSPVTLDGPQLGEGKVCPDIAINHQERR